MNIFTMIRYAKALREAAEAEKELIGNSMLEDEALGYAMIGRAERVEKAMECIR